MSLMAKIKKIDEIPTTRIRILITIGLISATVGTWLYHACDVRNANGMCVGWEPSANMLIFLGTLAGVDVAQYLSRGVMSKVTTPVTNPAVDLIQHKVNTVIEQDNSSTEDCTETSDISEINSKG